MQHSFVDIEVSACETHHVQGGRPLYSKRFLRVLKYHDPGLAPVVDEQGAYHIDPQGYPAYEQRFLRTFGFYQKRAAVESSQGWFHILPDGMAFYSTPYLWCGNFQEGLCPVRSQQGDFFYVTLSGVPLSSERYVYVGDFKEGMAVVAYEDGLHTHIDRQGVPVHGRMFPQLDVYHKGLARAKDKRGWSHINKQGDFIYPERYAMVEPFYNGVARVENFAGKITLIDELGRTLKVLYDPANSDSKVRQLSEDMVGFWKTWTLYTAIHFKIPDFLPATTPELALKVGLPVAKVARLLRALWELDILYPTAGQLWTLTEKGKLLQPVADSFLAAAGLMWGQVNKVWQDLPDLIADPLDACFSSFKENEQDDMLLHAYHQALDGYTQQDFLTVSSLPLWQNHQKICGFGRCSLVLLSLLLSRNVHLTGKVFGSSVALGDFALSPSLKGRLQILTSNDLLTLFDNMPSADAVIFPRFLHGYNDAYVTQFLRKAQTCLTANGAIYILEMLLEDDSPQGGLFDLNMLVEMGGKVRSLQQWQQLGSLAGIKFAKVATISPVLALLKGNTE